MVGRDEFEQICSKCGAVFRVDVPRQAGCEESEEYFCPKCFCMYKTRAAYTPAVTLISKRTDGKIDKCSNPYE